MTEIFAQQTELLRAVTYLLAAIWLTQLAIFIWTPRPARPHPDPALPARPAPTE